MNRPVRSPAQAIGTAELPAFLEKALSRHVAPPRRLQGEFYASNVLVQEQGEGLRVVPSR
jgi:hypothetical protein